MDVDVMAATLAETVRRCDDDTLGEGCGWYDDRAPSVVRQIARESGLPFRRCAGILAAANTNASWAGSITLARKFAAQAAAGEPISGGLATVVDRVQRIVDGERPLTVLKDWPKIGRFYRNIVGDHECVTVDRWAARAAGAEHLLAKAGGYEAIEDAYQRAAAEVGLPPAMVQAVVWVAVRGSAE